MSDAVTRYLAATESGDLDGVIATMTPGVVLISPLSGRLVFRGRADLRILLAAVLRSLSDLRWREEVGDGSVRVVIGDARVGPVKMSDAMVLDLAADGQIRRIRPHLRPWLALTLLALKLGPALARHPGLVARALRRA